MKKMKKKIIGATLVEAAIIAPILFALVLFALHIMLTFAGSSLSESVISTVMDEVRVESEFLKYDPPASGTCDVNSGNEICIKLKEYQAEIKEKLKAYFSEPSTDSFLALRIPTAAEKQDFLTKSFNSNVIVGMDVDSPVMLSLPNSADSFRNALKNMPAYVKVFYSTYGISSNLRFDKSASLARFYEVDKAKSRLLLVDCDGNPRGSASFGTDPDGSCNCASTGPQGRVDKVTGTCFDCATIGGFASHVFGNYVENEQGCWLEEESCSDSWSGLFDTQTDPVTGVVTCECLVGLDFNSLTKTCECSPATPPTGGSNPFLWSQVGDYAYNPAFESCTCSNPIIDQAACDAEYGLKDDMSGSLATPRTGSTNKWAGCGCVCNGCNQGSIRAYARATIANNCNCLECSPNYSVNPTTSRCECSNPVQDTDPSAPRYCEPPMVMKYDNYGAPCSCGCPTPAPGTCDGGTPTGANCTCTCPTGESLFNGVCGASDGGETGT